jgi:chorismate-pyruvate lyase
MWESATPRASRAPKGLEGYRHVTSNGATRITSKRAPGRRAGPASRVPAPLDVIYTHAGIPAPRVTTLMPDRIPKPYRSLLVHERDMTRTLEAHHDGRVALRTLSSFRVGHFYFRKVLLVEESSGRPVEMGVIEVDLEAFDTRVRDRILRNRVPLGRLLREGGVDYLSRPKAFLAVRPNPELLGVFWMAKARTLYGRQTELTLNGRKIGGVVEILPLA